MIRTLVFVLAVLLCREICEAKPRVQKRDRYVLTTRSISRIYLGYKSKDWELSIWDRKKRRVLWKRLVNSFEAADVHWSKDRRAVAIETVAVEHQILVWREGYRLREFGAIGGYDYPMGCIWSPDNRRLLVRFGRSADSDFNYGSLYCLQLSRWPYYKYFKLGDARKMAWKSRRTAIFWELEDDSITLKKPKLWRAP